MLLGIGLTAGIAGCRPGSMSCAGEVAALPARLRHWAELCR